ncbi:phage tail protein [Alteromonas sp. CYL-A6]|uniref:phage tail protein n=1 Tax=Alteromonas nitratireducens TaxID=3390813 RepID=UPI0034BAC989
MKIRLLLVALPGLVLAGVTPLASACGSNPMLGGICGFAGNFAPRGYALANGQLLPISSNPSLFSLFGTIYGGDGRTTFALPDLRGRTAIGFGNGPGLSFYRQGQRGGQETVTLTVAQLPNHSHSAVTTVDAAIDPTQLEAGFDVSLHAANTRAGSTSPNATSLGVINQRRAGYYTTAAPDVTLSAESLAISIGAETTSSATTAVTNNGGGQAHENRMPYLTLNWIVALQGIFPSRS